MRKKRIYRSGKQPTRSPLNVYDYFGCMQKLSKSLLFLRFANSFRLWWTAPGNYGMINIGVGLRRLCNQEKQKTSQNMITICSRHRLILKDSLENVEELFTTTRVCKSAKTLRKITAAIQRSAFTVWQGCLSKKPKDYYQFASRHTERRLRDTKYLSQVRQRMHRMEWKQAQIIHNKYHF